MKQGLVLVTGANGRTGRRIVAALSARGASIRTFLRKPEQADALTALGATEHAIGDFSDRASMEQAVKGCATVIHVGPPMHADEVTITGQMIDAARQSGVEHFIYYSVMHPVRREVRHHRLKLDAEEQVIESGMAYTIIQPSRYMQHLDPIWKTIVTTGVHRMPFSTEKKFSVVDLDDLAEAVALIATTDDHLYATYELAGPEPLSQNDMARIISERIDRQVSAEATDLNELAETARRNGLPEDRIEQMLIMNRHYDRHGFVGNPNVLRWILNREPTSFHDYVARFVQKDGH